MSPVAEVLDAIDADRDPLVQMAEQLAAPGDWAIRVLETVARIPDDEIMALNAEGLPTDVDPRILCVAERPGTGSVRVNFFGRDAFEKFWQRGTLSPHYHRRSFATRILRGSYQHLLFDNTGSLDAPALELRSSTMIRVGDGYSLPWQDYHFVMYPETSTTTLTFHTEPQVAAREQFIPRSRDAVLGLRDEIALALEAVTTTR